MRSKVKLHEFKMTSLISQEYSNAQKMQTEKRKKKKKKKKKEDVRL